MTTIGVINDDRRMLESGRKQPSYITRRSSSAICFFFIIIIQRTARQLGVVIRCYPYFIKCSSLSPFINSSTPFLTTTTFSLLHSICFTAILSFPFLSFYLTRSLCFFHHRGNKVFLLLHRYTLEGLSVCSLRFSLSVHC